MDFFEQIVSDYKAELVASQILASDTDFSKIMIDRLGHLPRTYTKDVYHAFDDVSDVSLNSYRVLQSFRQSIYEAIPESVFHPPTLGGLGRSSEEIIAEIKEQRKKENEARQFFKPFEQEAPYVEIAGLMTELMYEKKNTYDNLYHLFEQSWPIIKQLPRAAALSFIYMLPILNEISGKQSWVARCLSFLLDMPVTIQESFATITVPEAVTGFVMGEAALGLSTALPGRQDDGCPTWVLHIGPVPREHAMAILPQSGFEELVDDLLAYLAPAHIFIHKHIIVDCKVPSALSTEDIAASRLGYTFII